MATNVELYEALKPYIGEEAAGMIAETVPPAKDIATTGDVLAVQNDVQAVRTDVARLEGRIDAVEARLETKIAESEARISRALLTYFIPIWVIVGSMAVAIVGLIATRT